MFIHNIFICSLSIFILFFTIGCDDLENQLMDQINDDGQVDEMEKTGSVVFASMVSEAWGTDEYVINAAIVQDEILHINVSYTGGCETHTFTLVAEPMFLESFPVQLRVSLAHNANGDTCKESLTEDYSFDITPIKEVYQKDYRTDEGTIVLRLKDGPPSDLFYDF